MKDYQQLKRNQKKDLSGYPSVKVALRGEGVERGYHMELWEAEFTNSQIHKKEGRQ